VRLPVLIAAEGAAWETALVLGLESADARVNVVRRCVDVVDLLAVAISGQARAALVAAGLRRLDADAVDRLLVAGVVPIGVFTRSDDGAEDRLRAMGIVHVVPSDADPKVVASVIEQAVLDVEDSTSPTQPSRTFAGPAYSTTTIAVPPMGVEAPAVAEHEQRGSLVVVWGPAGAPGRSTVALGLADELSRLGCGSLLMDADVYGGVLAPALGLLDESPGLAAACRQAGLSRLGAQELAGLCWQLSPTLRVLTGIPRADRWPELRASAVENVVAAARRLTDFVVVDVGFCLESDEELSYDSMAPRRNGLTLAMLDAADLIVVVGSADPIGVQRLVRGLSELRDVEVTAPVWVVLNRVRCGVVPGDPAVELAAALDRFAGRTPAALLPFDQDAVDAALAVGKTLAEARPASPLRHTLAELAAAVAGVPARPRRRHRRG
jgi:Flp pilus assembly CpaE family ATPase